MVITSSSFELHPPGSFYGTIVRIDEDISKFDAKPQLVLTVETEPIYGEKKERSLLYWTSTSLSPQSKLGSVYMAVSGEEVSAGLTINTNETEKENTPLYKNVSMLFWTMTSMLYKPREPRLKLNILKEIKQWQT